MSKWLVTWIAIIFWFCGLTNSWAALSAGVNWDVATTGAAANGGGFNASPHTSTPSAPTINTTTGGTITVGTYYCVVTYTDAYSETKASGESSIVIPDATNDAFIVTSPSATTNAVNYKVYCGTVSSGPYYIQNGTGTAVGTNYTRTTTPATTGDEPSRTDYSQQDAAQLSITDGATSGISAILTSTTGGFTQAMIGNILYVASGTNFTVGYYEIISVADTNTLTVDRNIASGVGSGGNIAIGGRTNHPNTISASVVAGNIIHIKNGTFVKVGANAYVLNCTVAGGAGTPILWIGYNAAHLDDPTDNTRPLFSGDSDNNGTGDTTNVITKGNLIGNSFMFLRLEKATADNMTGGGGSGSEGLAYFIKSSSAGDAGFSFGGDSMLFVACESNNNSGEGFECGNADDHNFFYCYFHDNTANGYAQGNSGGSNKLYFSIADSNAATGIILKNAGTAVGTIAYNNTGASSDGIEFGGNAQGGVQHIIFNSVSLSNGRDGIRRTGTTVRVPYCNFNLLNSNTGAAYTNLISGVNDLTSAPSLTDAPGGDFTASSSSSPLVGAGFPQAMPGATGDYSWNIGVDQDDNTVGGAANDVFGTL